MLIYPKYYCDKVTDISTELFEKNSIKGVILDVDNTLIDYDRNLLEGVQDWIKLLKNNNIKCVILSNSNKVDKIKNVAEILDIPYIYFATKPLKRGFKIAKIKLELEEKNIAVIGDQIFTDVIGANRCKMFSILVNPISKKDIWMTKFKRPIEELIIKKYLKDKQKRNEE